MQKQKIFIFITSVFILTIFISPLKAQFKLERSVFGSGGGMNTSDNNSLIGTFGQTFIGVSENTVDEVYSGFWYINQTLVGISDEQLIPKNFELYPNYPNPFNPSTKIKYSVPVGANGHTPLQLKVYDILGREIATLVNEKKAPGNYEVNFNAKNLPSGVYLYRIQAGSFKEVRKMILLK
jgi:hypothetical protein